MKHNYITEVLFSDINPRHPDTLSHLGKVFTIVMVEIRLLNFSSCRIGDLSSVVLVAQI